MDTGFSWRAMIPAMGTSLGYWEMERQMRHTRKSGGRGRAAPL